MLLYLVQHGVAKPGSEDPDRPLTAGGRDEVERVARAAAAVEARPACILHSGKTRARETAEILAMHLKPDHGVHAAEGMAPKDPPERIVERIDAADAPLMLVGHLPHLARLAGLLVAGPPECEPVAFRNAGVVCLERRDGAARFALRWLLTPELVPR